MFMTKQSIAIALALIVAIMPFLGFPSEMNDIYYTAAGIIIASLVHLSSIKYCHVCKNKIDNGDKEEERNESEEENEDLNHFEESAETYNSDDQDEQQEQESETRHNDKINS